MGYWEFDNERKRLSLSDEVLRIYELDIAKSDVDDMRVFYDSCHPEDKEKLRHTVDECVDRYMDSSLEYRILTRSGQVKHLSMHISAMIDKGAVSSHILGIIIDITARKESEQEILQLAYSDTLTGLPNRALLGLYIDQAIPRAHFSGLCVAVLAIDLDLFNRINNAMGHSAGDMVLQDLAVRLNRLVSCRENSVYLGRLSNNTILDDIPSPMVARLGADSFVIVLPNVDRNSSDVEDLASRLGGEFQSPFGYRGQELFVTSSVGVAYSESGSTTTGVILQQADLAMHEAKIQGRNTLREFSGDLVAKVSMHLSIQTDLRSALQNGDFRVYYQPKISSKDQSLCGFEALVRWYHPTKGMIPPDQFIAVAEETGQIVELGRWVLETACRQTKQWIDQGLIDVRIAVNVAARQFKEGNLVEVVESVLGLTGLDEKHLELEITEGILISDSTSSEHIAALRERGITIALDDFGTGYSSLSYITRFPIDTIKVDRSFVQDIAKDSQKAVIVAAVADLAHGLGYKVVAEGVETEQELEVIRALNCDEVQGYYYCRPIPADEMTEWLLQRSSVAVLEAGAK
jgi:diguanylate cyclase (GGDEF)-like protein/PAS domain S-box-containing protein